MRHGLVHEMLRIHAHCHQPMNHVKIWRVIMIGTTITDTKGRMEPLSGDYSPTGGKRTFTSARIMQMTGVAMYRTVTHHNSSNMVSSTLQPRRSESAFLTWTRSQSDRTGKVSFVTQMGRGTRIFGCRAHINCRYALIIALRILHIDAPCVQRTLALILIVWSTGQPVNLHRLHPVTYCGHMHDASMSPIQSPKLPVCRYRGIVPRSPPIPDFSFHVFPEPN
jgi:hypothetical protein